MSTQPYAMPQYVHMVAWSVQSLKKKKKPLPPFPNYQLVAAAHISSTHSAFLFVSHLTPSLTCSEVHTVRQVRVVLQMFALQGLCSCGLSAEWANVRPYSSTSSLGMQACRKSGKQEERGEKLAEQLAVRGAWERPAVGPWGPQMEPLDGEWRNLVRHFRWTCGWLTTPQNPKHLLWGRKTWNGSHYFLWLCPLKRSYAWF